MSVKVVRVPIEVLKVTIEDVRMPERLWECFSSCECVYKSPVD